MHYLYCLLFHDKPLLSLTYFVMNLSVSVTRGASQLKMYLSKLQFISSLL